MIKNKLSGIVFGAWHHGTLHQHRNYTHSRVAESRRDFLPNIVTFVVQTPCPIRERDVQPVPSDQHERHTAYAECLIYPSFEIYSRRNRVNVNKYVLTAEVLPEIGSEMPGLARCIVAAVRYEDGRASRLN